MNKLPLLGALALTTAAAIAQQATLPASLNTVSCCSSANVWRAGVNRVQCIYDSTSVNPYGLYGPILINNLEYRLADALPGAAVAYPLVEVYLQYAATNYATPSITFAANRTVAFPTAPNYVGPVNVALSAGTTPNSYAISIPLATPFLFDPSLGQDLLIELVTMTAPLPVTGSTLSTANTVGAHLCNSVRITNTTSLTGAASAFCPVVRLSYTILPGTAEHEPYGSGCYTIASSFYELFPGSYPASSNDLTGKTVQALQNGGGGYTVTTTTGATVVPPTTTGLALTDDLLSAAITLPFTFHYAGGSTTAIVVDSNGSIILNPAVLPAPTSLIGGNTAALLNGPHHRIAAAMQDLLPDGLTNVANVFAQVDPTNANVFLITWVNVPCFATTPPPTPATSTFQIALIDNGTSDSFQLRYQTLVNDSDSNAGVAVTGFSRGNASLDGGSRDLTATVITTGPDLGPLAITTSARPMLGVPVTYSLTNMRANIGIGAMLISFTPALAGISLPSIGVAAPGCSAYIDPINNVSFSPLLFGSPTAGFSRTWPIGPYVGAQLYVQGFELSPAENPVGVISSHGLKITLGLQ